MSCLCRGKKTHLIAAIRRTNDADHCCEGRRSLCYDVEWQDQSLDDVSYRVPNMTGEVCIFGITKRFGDRTAERMLVRIQPHGLKRGLIG